MHSRRVCSNAAKMDSEFIKATMQNVLTKSFTVLHHGGGLSLNPSDLFTATGDVRSSGNVLELGLTLSNLWILQFTIHLFFIQGDFLLVFMFVLFKVRA